MLKSIVVAVVTMAVCIPITYIVVNKDNPETLNQEITQNPDLEKTENIVETNEPEIKIESSEDNSIKTPTSTPLIKEEIKTPSTTTIIKKPVATTTPSVPTSNIPKSTNIRWGVYVGYSEKDLNDFEEMVGSESDMRGVFVNWNDEFPTEFGKGLKSDGKAMVIYWEQYGVTIDDIISGKSDAYIKQFAKDAETYGGEVILSPLHEMNGDWDPWGGMVGNNTPAKVIKVWQKIHTVFGDVPNVKFAWAVNNISVPNTPQNAIEYYYPGDSYVDYVAVDGFNFNEPWQTFDEIFGEVLNDLNQYNKPIYILSMASAEGPKKAVWIKDAFEVQLPKYPKVKGWVWFNEDKEKDWRVNSDEESLEAFSESIK